MCVYVCELVGMRYFQHRKHSMKLFFLARLPNQPHLILPYKIRTKLILQRILSRNEMRRLTQDVFQKALDVPWNTRHHFFIILHVYEII